MCLPEADCTYLIMPIALVLIVRIVISMGVFSEIKSLYAIVFLYIILPIALVSNWISSFYPIDHDHRVVQN